MTDYVTLLAILSSIIIVPLIWLKLRGEKAGDPEGGYPDPTIRPYPSEKFGEFKGEGLSPADLPIFGPSRSTAKYHAFYFMQREWLHPDITRRRKLLTKIDEEKTSN